MEPHSVKYKTGLGAFVIIGLALLMAAIFYIGKQRHLFNPVFNLTTTFYNIGGLEIGNNVRFLGINVGTVENIEILTDSTVKVSLIIDKDVQKFIKSDSYVHISSDGLIGDKVAHITAGSSSSPYVKEFAELASIEPLETDVILENLNETGENATIVSGQLAEILYKVNNGEGIISRLIQDTSIAENIDHVIRNLKSSSRGLNENMEAAKHNIFFRGYFKNKNKAKNGKADRKEKTSEKSKDGKKSLIGRWKEKRQERKSKRQSNEKDKK